MLSNSENMVLISPSPTTNQWQQTQIDDAIASSGRVMEKPGPQELLQQQQQQRALNCPRCDSTNTKFCYYNNYSLSQPRHFCKACKRYWTRGGTLRNVPAGGGFRRNNKRVIKRQTNSSSSSAPSSTSNPASSQPQMIDPSSTSSHVTPMFYGLSNSDVSVNLPFTRFNSTISGSGYDLLQPRMNALGLGFSSAGFMSNEASHNNNNNNGEKNGSTSYYDSIFGSNYRSSNSTPIMPNSLFMNSGVKDGPVGNGSNVTFEGLAPQMGSNSGEAGVVASKDVKVEGAAGQNQIMEHVGLYDSPSLYYNWNTSTPMVGGVWNDNQANNIGPSSVTSFI